MKFIREGRMGPPKSFKTGAVVGTYPKPMLVLSFDEGGTDVVPSRNTVLGKDDIRMDVCAEEVVKKLPRDFVSILALAEQPKVTVLDFCSSQDRAASEDFRPKASSTALKELVDVSNRLYAYKENLPWKTVVLDPVTGMQDAIIAHIAQVNSVALNDARVWAFQAGEKVRQVISTMLSLPAHVVIIMHTELEKNELSGAIVELPMIASKVKYKIANLFSQFFYTSKQSGKPVVFTTDAGFTRSVGLRWPTGLPAQVSPDFHSIYGKEQL